MEALEEKLKSFLKTGADWARLKTSVPGVFVLKLPPFRGNPARLAVELNPTDDAGNPTRRRGVTLRDFEELEQYKQLFQMDKLEPLVKSVETANPAEKRKFVKPGEDVLEI
ncbi:MAG: hypothetical protein QXF24_02120 [Thermoproteota archaeon]